MLNPDEIMNSGFAQLKTARSSKTMEDLARCSRRHESQAKLKRTLGAVGACAMIVLAASIFARPTSAYAALMESARLTAAQPVIHVHFEHEEFPENVTTPPWPQRPAEDIWKFTDRYFRKSEDTVVEFHKDGTVKGRDDRFPFGYQSTYDASKDKFWSFDGTISIELSGAHRNPPIVKNALHDGTEYTAYEWRDTDGMGNEHTNDIFVDPNSKLVRYSDSSSKATNGDVSRLHTTVDYPNASKTEKELSALLAGTRLRTKKDLIAEFNRRIGQPDQTKSVGGVRVSLFGVVVSRNVPDGLNVEVITKGAAGPDYGSEQQVEILGSPLLATKRLEWFPPLSDPQHIRNGFDQVICGKSYIVDQCNDLLMQAPSRITVKVPVWRLSPSTIERDGKIVHPHNFVGYVIFTTSKIFYSVGDSDWQFYKRSKNLVGVR